MTRHDYEQRIAALKSRYRYLFEGDHLGHDILPGWVSIIEELCARLDEAFADHEKPKVHFDQIKEKLGGLRAYLNVAPLRLDILGDGPSISGYLRREKTSGLFTRLGPLIRAAEEQSLETCCFCAAPGKLRGDRSWLLTLCDRHEPCTYRDLGERFEEVTTP